LVRSNSAACLSFITARASASVCWPVSGCGTPGDLAVDLDGRREVGGEEQVRAFLRLTISAQQVVMNFEAWSRSIDRPTPAEMPSCGVAVARFPWPRSAGESSWGGLGARFGRRDDVAPHQVGRFWSSVCMPRLWPVWIAEYICAILFSRIRFGWPGCRS
jgi:hypothetical protein